MPENMPSSPAQCSGSQSTPMTHGCSTHDGNNDPLEPLAIIGFSLEYPQDANTQEGFWGVLEEKRDVMTEWPPDRLNLDAFFYRDASQKHQKLVAGAHFLTEDLGAFDASFFGISATEAMAMDIQQRKLLEITYHAFENAGIPMEKFYGSKTGVYSGSMSDDYQQILAKDIDCIPKYSASGVAKTMVANRLSWFYDFHGPSICMDSACSSSLMAFDFACQGLRNKDCNMAVVTGSSLVFAPDGTLSLMNMSFLSPRGRCHSFDDRADGYSRGEGFGIVILKRLADAIRDGDSIRAVVRSSGSNQDGHTPGVTQPSRQMQAALIRETYAKAGLDIASTRFFEAHGTGTPLGDPIEADAIGSVFRTARSQQEPLYVGALKSNIGHLEGGSGIAAVIKTVMVLEKGIIPPNANFENLNPRIDADFHNLKFPTENTPWPCSGLRRASIASFGFGGSNSHVVLDDAYNYLSSRGLEGIHFTSLAPPTYSRVETENNNSSSGSILNGHYDDSVSSRNGSSICGVDCHGEANIMHAYTARAKTGSANDKDIPPLVESLHDRLLVLSAADEQGIRRLAEAYESYFQKFKVDAAYGKNIDNLCHTLCARRSSLSWKSYAVVNSLDMLKTLGHNLSKPEKSKQHAKTMLVFTGQGAQYPNMGRRLVSYPVFRGTIERFDQELLQLGCTWSVSDVLEREESSMDIDDPEVSQTTTTALQMALYDLLQVLGVQVSVVVGHSSGEIAAAYASNALSLKSACKVSYYRGRCASSLKLLRTQTPGAMMSVDLPEADMQKAITQFRVDQPLRGMPYIACVNSPSNVTVSGDEGALDALQTTLDARKVRTRKLNTGVAYHSPHMKEIAQEYANNLILLEVAERVGGNKPPIMVSSVSGEYVQDLHDVCTADYWVANLLSPVQFSRAVSVISSRMGKRQTRRLGEPKLDIEDVVEIGPHSALRRPIVDCLEHHGVPQAYSRYHSALSRGSPAIRCVLNLIGELYTRGYPVNVQKANEIGWASRDVRILTDLPSYPFNHSKTYWHETAISRNARLRNGAAIHELLGVPVPDWNPLEPRWRKFFDLNEMPWIGHHQVNGRIIYPAAGMVTMALQGAEQVAGLDRRIVAYQVRDAVFTAPISIGKTDKCEVQLHMRLDQAHTDQHTTSLDFRIYSRGETGWFQNCSGRVQVLYQKDDESHSNSATVQHEASFYQRKYAEVLQSSTIKVPKKKMYDQFVSNGLQYGPAFQPLDDLAWDGRNRAVGTIKCFRWNAEHSQHDRQPHIVHPTVLDAAGQLPWVCLTDGAQQAVVNGAAVTRIQHAWIASSGLSYPDSSYLNACCITSVKGLRGTDSSIFALDRAGNLVLRVSHVETTAVGGDETDSLVHSSRKICYEMRYKPDLDLLDETQLQNLVNIGLQADSPPVSFYQDLELALFFFVTRALNMIESLNIRDTDMEPCIAKYASWLRRQESKYHSGDLPHSRLDWITRVEDASTMEDLLDRLAATNPEGQFLIHVGRNLNSIISGLTDPLEVMFKSGLAERHYEAVCDRIMCCKQLKNYLDALSHKTPQLKVLEVGAGTGSITRHVFQGLGTQFVRYDYTDISGAFFEQARTKFAGLKCVNYKVLDIERDPAEQGYEPRSYDVVIAAWVLHATRDLATTITNVRKLLRPGGKLVLLEITEPDLLRNGFAFGTLPGWWLSTEPEREWSPCLSEARWKQILVDNGFQGVDIVLPDYDNDICHENSILIATAVEGGALGDTRTGLPTSFTIVITPGSSFQRDVAARLDERLEKQAHGCCSTMSIKDPDLIKLTHTVMIILAELDQPFLSRLEPSSFELLQDLLGKTKKVLWATSSPVYSASFPEVQMVLGLSRVLSVERPGLSFVTLSFSSPSSDIELFVRCISQVVSETVAKTSFADRDLEYMERGGAILINRIMDADEMNEKVYGKTHAMIRRQSLLQSPPMVLCIPNSGLLDSVRWEEDSRYWTELGADEIEIEVQGVGVNFRDLLVVLGKYNASTIGCECAGIVARIGTNCNTLKPGDRVCACLIGCSNTHARCHYLLAVKIPDFLSTVEAASLPCTGVTAYYSLISLAHLRKEDSILIHSATGGTGQMAVQIAKAVGAEVFVTVGNEEKRRLIKDLYGVPDDHIFNSRDTSFARDIYCATNGRGVDVVLNSLSKEALLASWECIAPFGRFVELGKMDIEDNSRLPMAQFSKNVTFHAVAIDHLATQKPQVVGKILQSVLDMIRKGLMRVASPLQPYRVSDLESAFRSMQSGKNTGKMVLTFGPSDIVPVSYHAFMPVLGYNHIFHGCAKHEANFYKTWLRPKYTCALDPKATYLIAGGLGGLGRSAARWMAGRGARNLILLSRSGPRSASAYALMDGLKEAGLTVRTPRCDVSDPSSLASALAMCSDMPPIKGCLQATMVLQDALFESMTWDQWSISIRSKVESTWNLHRQLPHGLVFFVILSSVAGIAGSMGQSNYAAGNTFQDGLAAHRLALGEKAVSIDLGWMGDVGAVAENAALTKGKENAGDLAPIYENEFLALLDHYCDPELQILTPEQAQPVIGIVTPAQFRAKGLQPPDWLVDRPLFRGLAQEVDEQAGGTAASENEQDDRDWVSELLRAASGAAAANVVVDALVQRLSKATSISPVEIDRARPLHAYGVDSLLAVELRNWFSKLFKADVAIFDITGQTSLEKIAEGAAESSMLLKSVKG